MAYLDEAIKALPKPKGRPEETNKLIHIAIWVGQLCRQGKTEREACRIIGERNYMAPGRVKNIFHERRNFVKQYLDDIEERSEANVGEK